MYHCFKGKMVDCTDYPDHHYAENGEVSKAWGLGVAFLRPDRKDFANLFGDLLDDDTVFDSEDVRDQLNSFLEHGRPQLDVLIALMEDGGGANEAAATVN